MVNNNLKDFFDNDVNIGDEVVLLVKNYGYKCISNCYLRACIYKGKNQYGHIFYDIRNKGLCSHAYHSPVVVKLSKKGGE